MKRILIISPNYGTGGVIYKHVRLLAEALSIKMKVCIATRKNNMERSQNCDHITSAYIPSRYYESFKARLFPNFEFAIPDLLQYTIGPFLHRKCDKYMQREHTDVIHSVSWACSSHLIALKLKKKYGTFWVAHFMDAWIENPYRHIPNTKKKLDESYERLVAINADVILHTNREIVQSWIDRYGEIVKDKIFVFPFCYSQDSIDKIPPIKKDLPLNRKIIMSYIGTSAGDRNFQTLIDAFHQLSLEDKAFNDRFEIRIYGNLLDCDRKKINMYCLNKVFVYKGRVSGDQLKKSYEKADIFLVIDSPNINNYFFPSKLLDYFYYRKPILGLSPQKGVTTDLLLESGNYVIENNDLSNIIQYLKLASNDFTRLTEFDKEYYKNFSPHKLIKAYSKLTNKQTNS